MQIYLDEICIRLNTIEIILGIQKPKLRLDKFDELLTKNT